MRGSAVKAGPLSRGGEPWRVKSPGELRASVCLNSRRGVADSRVEQTPEGGEASADASNPVRSGLRTGPAFGSREALFRQRRTGLVHWSAHR
jgi:hypothetical protein